MTASIRKNSIFAAATTLALAPAAALIFLAPGAAADTPAKIATMEVHLRDVGEDADGRSLAPERIEAAAKAVCGKIATHSPLLPRELSDCVRDTATQAMRQLTDLRSNVIVARAD